MRVRAIAEALTPEQRDRIGGRVTKLHGGRRSPSDVEPGKEYVVLELVFTFNREDFGSTVWVGHLWGKDYLVHSPIELFEVIDPRPSRHWEFTHGEGEARLRPAMLREYPSLTEDAEDGVMAAVEQWRELRQLFDVEDAEGRG